jgi:hypothetical protein
MAGNDPDDTNRATTKRVLVFILVISSSGQSFHSLEPDQNNLLASNPPSLKRRRAEPATSG